MTDQMTHVNKCFKGIRIILSELELIDPNYKPLTIYKKTKEGENSFAKFYSTILSKSDSEKESK